MPSFKEFTLRSSLLQTLEEKEFTTPTEIQTLALPPLLKGKSVAGVAETGTGKTLAYALAVLNTLKQLEDDGDSVTEKGLPRAVVLVPSSDLGEQVSRAFKDFTHHTRIRVRTGLGGTPMAQARRNVDGPFEVLVATPGRLEQLIQRDSLALDDVRILVFDEADQMLDAGFLPVINRVLKKSPSDAQLALFTATAADAVQDLIREKFEDAEILETAGRHRLVSTLITNNLKVPRGKRFPLLEELLIEGSSRPTGNEGTLIFTNTKDQCDALAELLEEAGYDCAIYRGDMDKKERRKNLKEFREGTTEILISTDLAARGLDVENVDRVINYHLPRELKNYLHRAGRTARAGREGTVINFVTERDENLIKRLESID
ncbi:MAG: RNA helicase [Verrucomicrobiales bacterium]|nr:RNA helicase [Verrucomicrobiales bacterium]